MIVRIKKENEFDKKDLVMPWSIFPLANLSFYGLNKKIFSLYRTGKCYFSKYDDSIQICSNDVHEEELKDICTFVLNKKIRMITANPEIATKLSDLLFYSGLKNKKEDGWIMNINKFEPSNSENIFLAKKKNDFKQIAHVVCLANRNHINFYKEKQLYKQYFSRSKSGYCRNFYVKNENKIIGCISTYCETQKFAVIGGLAVDPRFQKQGFGRILFSGILTELNEENKNVFLFCYNDGLFKFYTKYSNNYIPVSKIIRV